MPWAGEISRVPQVNDDGLMGREGIRTDEGRKGPLKCHVKGPPKQPKKKRKRKKEKDGKKQEEKQEKGRKKEKINQEVE
eukprot:CAMPEP_0206132384 /NCGR_PEP_ID=MMETSP1472-20131121/49168_1 /ASSEMBLY_ACC=CAM_ASM_001108 /TAXON_ID=41880 /ORGANISM="Pycnococcus provasolii, Strain RCC251" /LENGTH=78 /DNA_ID=CAMNT_0053523889 /DNA_START=148 /DNA_END=384 /DNA_ORIENTATION=-